MGTAHFLGSIQHGGYKASRAEVRKDGGNAKQAKALGGFQAQTDEAAGCLGAGLGQLFPSAGWTSSQASHRTTGLGS